MCPTAATHPPPTLCLTLPPTRWSREVLDSCSHTFCYDCVERWATTVSSSCPLCKREISMLERRGGGGGGGRDDKLISSRPIRKKVQEAPEMTEEERCPYPTPP